MHRIFTFITILLFINLSLVGQQDFSALRPIDMRYKKLLKKAKEEDKLLLFIIHSNQVMNNSILLLDDAHNVEGFNEKVITSIVDIFKDDSHEVLKRIDIKTNPTYVMMNKDEVILEQNGTLSNVQDLLQFYGRSIRISNNFDESKEAIETGKSDQSYKEMITLLLNSKNVDLAEEYIEDWMQDRLPLRNQENHDFLAKVAEACICSDRLAAAFRSQEEQLIPSLGAGRYLGIRQAYILKELKKYDLVEPYTVWEVYNEEFGIYADSLFRRFAIQYYQFIEPNKEVLMDEIYDFLYYYPETSWADQKSMFDLAIKYTDEKEDFLLLLDMIEYQIYLGSDHEKLDYKAVIMYKLGNKERAVELMKEVEALKPDYTSMVHQLIEK